MKMDSREHNKRAKRVLSYIRYISDKHCDERGSKIVTSISSKPKRGKYSPLLGLNDKVIYNPTGFCMRKRVYLLYDDIRKKQCLTKNRNFEPCKHLMILEGRERVKGIKKVPMKYYKAKENSKNEKH